MSEHLVHMLRFGAVGDQFSRDMCSSACPPIESFHLSSIRAGQGRTGQGNGERMPRGQPRLAICWRGRLDRRGREQAVSSLLRQHPGNKRPWHLTPFRCQFPG